MSILKIIKQTCHTDWQDILSECIEPYKSTIDGMLKREVDEGNEVFPKSQDIFKAFANFDKKDLKVVILGQDAYHNKAKNGVPFAHGLCFSVPNECQKSPPSLTTIFKELEHEYGVRRTNTNLIDWSQQGVLLLNCALTVREGKPNSHMKVWKPFTEALLKRIANEQKGLVYILWGEFAKSCIVNVGVNADENLILTSRHPSPLAVSKGPFIGNMHFQKANDYLIQQGKEPIKWL
jgi:uracil-DNA glycosylase